MSLDELPQIPGSPVVAYRTYDYDTHEVIDYQREGACNGCGQCCLGVICFRAILHESLGENVTYDHENIQNGGTSHNGRGRWSEVELADGRKRSWQVTDIDRQADQRCPKLTEDMKCELHGRVSSLCSLWPMAPEHVTPFPECSFTFQEVSRKPWVYAIEGSVLSTSDQGTETHVLLDVNGQQASVHIPTNEDQAIAFSALVGATLEASGNWTTALPGESGVWFQASAWRLLP